MTRLDSWIGLAAAAWLTACALADSGTDPMTTILGGAGAEPNPRLLTGGTGATAAGGSSGTSGTGASPAGGTGGSPLDLCGNGTIDPGEECDLAANAPVPPLSICVNCRIDPTMLQAVTSRSDPPSFTDGLGRTHYYYLVKGRTFDQAAGDCSHSGGHLATLLDEAEYDIAADLLRDFTQGWVGARRDGASLPEWIVPGEAWETYSPPGGEDFADPGECIVLDVPQEQYRSRNCSESRNAVCEWTPPGAF